MQPNELRYIFAGDRPISVAILRFLLGKNAKPLALMVPDLARASHAAELVALCEHLPPERIWSGKEFVEPKSLDTMRALAPHYIFGIHFPLIFPERVLALPSVGVLNLHPAYLPYNRGWHNSAWALLDGTPYGGTLHFMNEGVDTGDIIHQKRVDPAPDDTGNTLYRRAVQAEIETFIEAWPALLSGDPRRTKQDADAGTTHRKKDLAGSGIQRIELDTPTTPRELLKKLRALTTNSPAEAAYFEEEGQRFRVRVSVERGD